MQEAKRLAQRLHADFLNVIPSADRAWSRDPALKVIDCVLSLNRRYDRFVMPRLDKFEGRFPGTKSVQSLRRQLDSNGKPEAIALREKAAAMSGVRLRDLDTTIREASARQ